MKFYFYCYNYKRFVLHAPFLAYTHDDAVGLAIKFQQLWTTLTIILKDEHLEEKIKIKYF